MEVKLLWWIHLRRIHCHVSWQIHLAGELLILWQLLLRHHVVVYQDNR